MPLKIKPVGIGDLEPIVQIEIATLKALDVFHSIVPKSSEASKEGSMISDIKHAMDHDTTSTYMAVINTDDEGKIVAFAKWQIPGKLLASLLRTSIYSEATKYHLTPATPTASRYHFSSASSTDGNGTHTSALASRASKIRMLVMNNEPHCFLAKLSIDPNYKCGKATSILLHELCKAADEHGLASYLDSSSFRYSLHEKYGFAEVNTITVDLRPWGGMGDYVLRNMVRPASKSA